MHTCGALLVIGVVPLVDWVLSMEIPATLREGLSKGMVHVVASRGLSMVAVSPMQEDRARRSTANLHTNLTMGFTAKP